MCTINGMTFRGTPCVYVRTLIRVLLVVEDDDVKASIYFSKRGKDQRGNGLCAAVATGKQKKRKEK